MRGLSNVLLLFGLVLSSALGQMPTSHSDSSSLAKALRQTGQFTVEWLKYAGTIEGGTSRVVFTALIVSETTSRDRKLAGIRIDFSDSGWERTFYVDGDKLEPLKAVADRLAKDLEDSARSSSGTSNLGFLGSCELRDNPDAYPLHFQYCHSGYCSPPGLMITSPTRIVLTGRRPADLAAVLGNAIDSLKAR